MSIIEHYKSYGENSKSFMNVARKVVVNKRCALAYQEGRKLAEEYATSYRTVNVSHQEFLTWKHGLIRSIEDDEIQVEANEYDDKEMKALMDGVEGYEDMVNSEEEWA